MSVPCPSGLTTAPARQPVQTATARSCRCRWGPRTAHTAPRSRTPTRDAAPACKATNAASTRASFNTYDRHRDVEAATRLHGVRDSKKATCSPTSSALYAEFGEAADRACNEAPMMGVAVRSRARTTPGEAGRLVNGNYGFADLRPGVAGRQRQQPGAEPTTCPCGPTSAVNGYDGATPAGR